MITRIMDLLRPRRFAEVNDVLVSRQTDGNVDTQYMRTLHLAEQARHDIRRIMDAALDVQDAVNNITCDVAGIVQTMKQASRAAAAVSITLGERSDAGANDALDDVAAAVLQFFMEDNGAIEMWHLTWDNADDITKAYYRRAADAVLRHISGKLVIVSAPHYENAHATSDAVQL